MKPRICQYESTLLTALAAGNLSAALRNHLGQCEACIEASTVLMYMNAINSENLASTPLPSADSIFWRAQIAERRRLAERSTASIRNLQRIAATVVLVFTAGFLAVWSPAVAKILQLSAFFVFGLIALLVLSTVGIAYLWNIDSRPNRSSR